MAKKVRRAPEDEAPAFEFPTFDETGFLTKEFELGSALALASVFALVAGVLSFAATLTGLAWYVPFGLGVVYVAMSPFALRRLRAKSELYTRGDWAALLALQFFGWLAIWFVLANVG